MVWEGAEDRQVVWKQFEAEGELVAAGAAAGEEGDGDVPEVRFGVGVVADAAAGAVDGPWPEAVADCGPAVAGDESGVGAGGKLLRSY